MPHAILACSILCGMLQLHLTNKNIWILWTFDWEQAKVVHDVLVNKPVISTLAHSQWILNKLNYFFLVSKMHLLLVPAWIFSWFYTYNFLFWIWFMNVTYQNTKSALFSLMDGSNTYLSFVNQYLHARYFSVTHWIWAELIELLGSDRFQVDPLRSTQNLLRSA